MARLRVDLSLSLLRADDKAGKRRGRSRIPSTGLDFAHSVTIFASGIDRFVGPESVQSEQVVCL